MLIPIKFFKDIEPENSTYQYVYVDLVHRCNMECNNCYLPNRDYADVDYDKLVEFINKFQVRTEFRLIGGEPTLYSRLPQLIQTIRGNSINHRVTLVTNGLKLASQKYVKKLKQSGLNRIYLSMNGFDDDDLYQRIDNMKCAKLKMKALKNILDNKIGMSVGFIVIKNINEYIIDKMINYFVEGNHRMTFEFRNIGTIGRNMLDNNDNYDYNQLIDMLETKFNFNKQEVYIDDQYSRVYKINKFIIRINDWGIFTNGMHKKANQLRGRMTENFRVASFFEHLKENEWEY